jgi:stringent starvation protein B
MIERDPKALAKLQAVVTALIQHRVTTSLEDLELSLAKWRSGELSALEAHGAVLKHAARCERTVERVTAAVGDRPDGIIRDAFDAGLIDEAEVISLVGQPPDQIAPAGALGDGGEDPSQARDKRAAVEELLERGPVLIHLDARRDDVLIPPRLKGDARLVLRFGYRLQPAIIDLAVDDSGISGTLTFGGMPFYCKLPWPAVYAAIVEGEQRGTVWPEDIPDVVMEKAPEPPSTEADASGPIAVPSAEGASTEPAAAAAARKRGGHLKLVD